MTQVLLGAVSLGLLWAIMTIGVYITYRVLDIADLSVEGTLPLGAAVACVLITKGADPYLASVAAMLCGCAAGMVTGLLHTKLKIPALLSGILTMTALYSINMRIMGNSPSVYILHKPTVFKPLQNLGLDANLSMIIVGFACAMLIISILYWFFGTELGSAIRATGNNQRMVRAQGINTDTMKILGLMLSNGLAALSGTFIAQNQSFADVQMGTGSIVIGLASLIIGEVLFSSRGFYGRLFALILGALVYRLIIAMVLKFGMKPNDLKLFTAITVAIALWLPQGKSLMHTVAKSLKKEDA